MHWETSTFGSLLIEPERFRLALACARAVFSRCSAIRVFATSAW
jgi:hypothetical protein